MLRRTMLPLVAVLSLSSVVIAEDVASAPGETVAGPPVVQVAILLDTSGSMDGLIDQAKAQLWSIVNEFATTQRDGQTPRLEVALFEYGNNGISADVGHIRMIQPLTTDLDAVSEGLFALSTNGGEEYCGMVIDAALKQLSWTTDPKEYRAIFIAGNEPFTQGPVDYREACKAAIERGIIVNTIHCGNEQAGVDGKWQDGAQLADGSFFTIDQDRAVAHVDAPQDAELARLNERLNGTYVWYGDAGAEAAQRQVAQDANAAAAAPAAMAERVASKGSSLYVNVGADLVDRVAKDADALSEVDEEALPEEMQAMSAGERREYVEAKAAERADLQQQIAELSREREAYVAEERRKQAEATGEATLGDAVLGAVREQAAAKGYK